MFMYSIGRFIIQFTRMDDVKFSIGNLGIQEAHIVTFSLFIITLILSILFLRVKGNNSDNDQKIKKASGRKRKSQARA